MDKIALIALVVSILSLGLSAFSIAYENKHAKDNLLRELYQTFLSNEEQACRRVLYEARDRRQSFDSLDIERQSQINHALSSLNIVGYLRERRKIPSRDAIDLIGSVAYRLDVAATEIGYSTYRENLTGKPAWPSLRRFAADFQASNHSGESD